MPFVKFLKLILGPIFDSRSRLLQRRKVVEVIFEQRVGKMFVIDAENPILNIDLSSIPHAQ